MQEVMDSKLLIASFVSGAKNLERHKAEINELNVFPVPDGDTGTNMSMTVMAAVQALSSLTDPDIQTVARTMSSGSLRGARGNSGVILSQLIRGFCKGVDGAAEIDVPLAAAASRRAVDTAYKAVMKPKEGTILTVARGISEKLSELEKSGADLGEALGQALIYGREVLDATPELLPVLKEAGVVDSGGQGLIRFLEGVLACLNGEETDTDTPAEMAESFVNAPSAAVPVRGHISTDDIKFGYCTEFIVNLKSPLSPEELGSFRAFLESIGDSVVCVDDDDMVKVHVHTNHPGIAFEKGLEIGESLSRMKVDNMREEHEETLFFRATAASGESSAESQTVTQGEAARERAETAFIAICSGAGFGRIFRQLGADSIIEGGQTMNPSTEDILEAVREVPADDIFIFPNNKNIILAAEQAAAICEDSRLHVVPTNTMPQGIAAMIAYVPGGDPDDNMEAMLESISQVRTGELTYAVRNTMVEGYEIKEGDIMGIGDRGILAVGEILNDTALETLSGMIDFESSMVTIYAGEGIDDSAADMLAEAARERFPEVEIETERGEQSVYYYIISVE